MTVILTAIQSDLPEGAIGCTFPMPRLRKWLILSHRYLGVALGLLFVVWFLSGIAMMYAGAMPELTPEERLARTPPLDLGRVTLTPADAAMQAGVRRTGRVVLRTVLDRPAYRFGAVTVFADTGEALPEIGPAEATGIAARFLGLPASQLRHAGLLEDADQWTLGQRRQLPLHKLVADDDRRTELYVSEETGDIAMLTTRGTRALAWVAAIPHWLYLTPLRRNDLLWRQTIFWTSGVGVALAVLGLVLAFTQYRVQYAGLMRWHYVSGVIVGVFTATWVFSGWLSMQPWDWSLQEGVGAGMRQALSGGSLELSHFPPFDPGAWEQTLDGRHPKEIELLRIQGEPYYAVRTGEGQPLLVGVIATDAGVALRRRPEPFSVESLRARAQEAVPEASVASADLLPEFDAYYYSRNPRAPLPVLRLKFADRDATWFYIDPRLGQVVARFTRRERAERWIYHGLHSLDFPFWYFRRPLWDIVVIALCLGGALSSGIGLFVGLRRMKRWMWRT